MKTSLILLLCLLLGTTIESLPASSKPRARGKGETEQGEMARKHRFLRERTSRRTSTYTDLRHIWYAAVSDTDTTTTVQNKCKLEDGTVVVIGEDFRRKKSSKMSTKKSMKSMKSKSGKSGSKSSSTIPEHTPTAGSPTTTLPTTSLATAPTECHGSSKSCRKSKKLKSSKGSMSMMSKSMMSKGMMSKSKSYKSSKGKGKSDLPYCSDLVTVAPTIAPTTAADLARCNDIRDGSGDTSGTPAQTFTIFVLVESSNNLGADFADKLTAVMRGLLAVASGCDNFQFNFSRRLNDVPTAVAVNKFELVDLKGRTCEQAFPALEIESMVCTSFSSDVSSFGYALSKEAVLQACKGHGPQVADALEVDKIQCSTEMVPAPDPPQQFLPATVSPTPGPVTRGGVSAGSGGGTDIDTPGWIAMSAGILILLSLCLCFCCYRRARRENKQVAYTKTFEEDESSLAHNETPEGATSTPLFFVKQLNSDTVLLESDEYAPGADAAPTDEEEEYHFAPTDEEDPPRVLYEDPAEQDSNASPVEEIRRHEKGELCSSPTCRICEDRRQEVTMVPVGPMPSRKQEYPLRDYPHDDTVEL